MEMFLAMEMCAPTVSLALPLLPLASPTSRFPHGCRFSSQRRLPSRLSTSALPPPPPSPPAHDHSHRPLDKADAFGMLQNQSKTDAELREILGDCIVDPVSSQRRVESRLKRKERSLLQPKLGSPAPMAVSFPAFDPHDSYIWLELYDPPKEADVHLLGNVFRSWYIIGNLGSFNSLNLQLTRGAAEKTMIYSTDSASQALPCNFHNSSDLEFQSNWGRIWVDLGSSDPLPWDVLINALASVSSDHIGIRQLIFGGTGMGGWQEDMTTDTPSFRVYKF